MRYKAYLCHAGIYPKTGKSMPKQYTKPFSEVQMLPERLEDPLHIKSSQRFLSIRYRICFIVMFPPLAD